MTASNVQRHQLIQRAMARSSGDMANVAVNLWQPLTSQLISIVGEGGFNALYARSLHLVSRQYPWLSSGTPADSGNPEFKALKSSLEKQDAADAFQASLAFLTLFTDALSSLIGESLTTRILTSAWGGTPDKDSVEKESR